MIAVLPFENLGNPEDEYFADGMTEEITSRLAGIAGLGVISRTSSMQYKHSNKSLSQIGKELGVNYILEGSVRWAKSGGQTRVRITPQLIRVSDDRHMWADNYERELMEIFAVQEDIATKIVNQLDLTLLESDKKILANRPTSNSKAYDYYLKGIAGIRRSDWSLPAMTSAAANLDSAVMVDPLFALAWANRSRAYTMLDWVSPSMTYRNVARESFEEALKLQPNLSYAHMAAGIYYNLTETDYDLALTELNRAYTELHSDADLVVNFALVKFRQGKWSEAEESFTKATELDPLNPVVHWFRGQFFRFERKFEEADRSVDRAIALDPARMEYYGEKMMACASRFGDWSKIRAIVHQALDRVDTLELVASLMSTVGAVSGPALSLSLDSLFVDPPLAYQSLLDRFQIGYREKFSPELYFLALAQGYGYLGNGVSQRVYMDSARQALERQLKGAPNQPINTSTLGIVLAYLGSCDNAVRLGIRGKELLSIAKCHW
jgi:TolB-like protein/Tfp pilus assembly protein PilF